MKELNKKEVIGIFPEPILNTKIDLKKYNKSFLKYKKDSFKNIGNISSNETYILNKKEFKNLKKELEIIVNDFTKQVLKYNKVNFYITQSWLNFTKREEYHHLHNHPNSIFSGVLYIKAKKDIDSISFCKDENKNFLEFNINEYNYFNATSWRLPVENGKLIIFRSTLFHHVEHKQDDEERISLAFNTFVKGNLGDEKKLTELKL